MNQGGARTGTRGLDAPSAELTLPSYPDWVLPDTSTAEGLAAAQEVLRRAMELLDRVAAEESRTGPDEAAPTFAGIDGVPSIPATHVSGGDLLAQDMGGVQPASVAPDTPNVGVQVAGSDQPYPVTPTRPTVPARVSPEGLFTPGSTVPASTGFGTGISLTGVGVPNYATSASSRPVWPGTATGNVPPPTTSSQRYRAPTLSGQGAPSSGFVGVPSHIKNAIKMIPPFYSDGSTVEKARAFWNTFERATVGLDETLRLSAFRERLRGKSGEEWWLHSKITDFMTLQIRFYNQFVCLTPLQVMERLSTAKRTRGMSADVWGDWISGICDDAQCFDPSMRYQYFLAGLRNSEWKAVLSTMTMNSIQQAVTVLLYMNMHLPVEDCGRDGFRDPE
ncbi:hypothetical protein PR003_g15513 [Phytophthora rubi]|uniref:Uncharacterized protein n=1 Tax=Phytophthora rubi TaxID=129364 RepID=A0A6A4EZB4_9STRA|nr:hypothetical protein PR002_g15240 [Phytophthora rubi]KAE9016137.1 hypothetical protein PR001_g14728 [Phytophthora rubi]KAE9329613.1 hypothetical protein PR003_g15513 [Phytophthora rubi]